MAVGNQANTGIISNTLSGLALQLRNTCQQITNEATYINTLGTAGLEALGFSPEDAATVQTIMAYLNNVAGVYYGTVYQGTVPGSGNCIEFNFNNALSAYWAGQ